jgi:hypothetical protein
MLVLLAFVLLAVVVIETGLAADDRVFYGLIGLFVLTQLVWLTYYLRLERKKEFVRNLERLFPND